MNSVQLKAIQYLIDQKAQWEQRLHLEYQLLVQFPEDHALICPRIETAKTHLADIGKELARMQRLLKKDQA